MDDGRACVRWMHQSGQVWRHCVNEPWSFVMDIMYFFNRASLLLYQDFCSFAIEIDQKNSFEEYYD